MVPRNNNTNRGVKGRKKRKKRNGRNGGEGSEEAQVEADVRARHATAVRHDSRLPPSFLRDSISLKKVGIDRRQPLTIREFTRQIEMIYFDASGVGTIFTRVSLFYNVVISPKCWHYTKA